ncbi:type I DNA topoisomerase [Leptospira borgpetersenii]|uniref:type I DNA topoisomerase n=1 Tax=Leptospira borgpetersenii TaxID=174 RepID=UPI0002974359|nr:type I DNA topoisomerase [Leptospira borgpetersenii]MBF3373656.1 type I DNA topoisomerase [Leptospira borgpetersenii serovar Arborea]APY24903.1 DNA topoisomerase 1 [Leptospira borgpetersenii str. 4E]EKR00644.1 DNA topoisomerase I [Leptospira borgpetersenii serovar Castellonis str. 200801910]KGE24350.1 DNA topoisomerase I [Leptospira borgpetersenii serovar Ballum]MBE8160668.1 type I DNA topoisomerase [Leptospira borgpetersenii serovar Ballum]
MSSLIIVESPSKAKTIGGYLGKEFRILATLGHVADLPKTTLGLDLKNRFEPEYVVLPGKKKILSEIIKAAKESQRIFLATDPDREGEFISAYIRDRLKKKSNVFRIRFTEITRNAILSSLQNPDTIHESLVEAQKTRRVGDRLIGYFISPVLWKEIGPGLSAGRVQSVALKWICDREDEIRNFHSEIYYNVLLYVHDKKGIEGVFQRVGDRIFSEEKANLILQNVQKEKNLRISEKKESHKKNLPPPPFQTASLQQEAFRKLRFSSKKTMSIAQKLYEGMDFGNGKREGLITYMRTDSIRLSPDFVERANSWIISEFGETFANKLERKVKKSSKKIQDAHEAIRITDPFLTSESAKNFLGKEEASLYELIWKRTISYLLPPEEFLKTEYSIFVAGEYFQLETKKTLFPGYKILNEADKKANPNWEKGELLTLQKAECEKKQTEPSPRYSEGTLVAKLEREGIGRPSTYSTVSEILVKRKYVEQEKKFFYPLPLGEKVNFFLQSGFGDLFREKFTAELESNLDRIEKNEIDSLVILNRLWSDLQTQIQNSKFVASVFRKEWAEIREKKKTSWGICPLCRDGSLQKKKTSRKKEFYQCSRFPDCEYVNYELPKP